MRIRATLPVLLLAAQPVAAQQPLPAVQFQQHGLKAELAPLHPDQVHAFFQGRGFAPEETARLVARGCVFRSAIGNAGDGAADPSIEVDLHHWRIDPGGGWWALKIKDAWLAEFAARGVPEPARIAFRWATFPTQQVYGPSDYNWGIFAFGLPAGTTFDLEMRWTEAGGEKSGTLRGLTCAAADGGG